MSDYLLECCVDSVESAMAAAEGGADRLELCAALIIGGISPSLALFKQVKECCALPVRVLLRPRVQCNPYAVCSFCKLLHPLPVQTSVLCQTSDHNAFCPGLPEQFDLPSDDPKFIVSIKEISKSGTQKHPHRKRTTFLNLLKQSQAR